VARPCPCAEDGAVFALVTEVLPPRPLPAFHPDRLGPLADLLVARFVRPGARRRS
jgi:hypothetical protein